MPVEYLSVEQESRYGRFATEPSPGEFDRAVVWLVNDRVLLPGVTTLARMVAALRQEENDRLHAALYDAVPYDLRTEMIRLLEVPEKRRVSEWGPARWMPDGFRQRG